ncbi:DNA-directed RNA polymerase subunit alpha [Miniphocaeibacter massiliensis]|uniref:DNA-directed RNA polymerase subunit alpha n=1 Tax=Miniphocaeibacter massiliensis TaxID=2041841 RepID=UPI000C1B87B4|nr:DNA-directed RNA polymerase subunit alpha [Miniphocaeibacter massiliensis]
MTENLNTKIEITDINEEKNYGKFTIAPLERGFGTTLGNSLRRVLLSSLPGSAVSKIQIEDVLHEFSTVKGVMEDVSEMILNIKGIAIKNFSDEPVTLDLELKGPHTFTAKDIEVDSSIEVANPDHYIATLNEDAHIKMVLRVENGKGYRISELNKSEDDAIGVIAIDSSFTPVVKVNFEAIEQVSNKEKLELEVWTNGTITSQEAISEGADILRDYLELFTELPNYDYVDEEEETDDSVDKDELYNISIEELDLSLRSFNCLKRAGIDTVGDIISKTTDEMCKIKNFGKKSLEEVENKVHDMGLLFADEEES